MIIPITKKSLVEREEQFKWMYRADFPDWGKGRDDAMNLTKYLLIEAEMDDTFGPSDMPSIWNLKKYDDTNTRMNWDGASHNAYSVVIDSALGLLGAAPKSNPSFIVQVNWLLDYLRNKEAPQYPFTINKSKAVNGEVIFNQYCATCHQSEKTGKPVPIDIINTSKNRLESWGKQYAVAANNVVKEMGLERKGLVEEELIEYNDQKIVLTETGIELLENKKSVIKRKEKENWIEKEIRSKITKLDKNSIFLPNQNELHF